MKRFIIRITLFFAILFIFDRVIGYPLSYMSKHAKGGYIWRQNYIADSVSTDILIFGSSRAIHHYNPQIIEDSLGMTCFNCGQDGNGVICAYGWWQAIRERYQPTIVIYDISPSYDLFGKEDNRRYLGWLKYSYENNEGIQQLFKDIDPVEDFKMNSRMYCYNSRFHQIIADYFHPVYQVRGNGFVPMTIKFDNCHAKKKSWSCPVDTQKIEYIKKLIDEMSGSRLVFVASPIYFGMSADMLQPIKDICQEQGILFLDFSNHPKYLQNEKYFSDTSHLNAEGADVFTRDLINRLIVGLKNKK